MGVVTIHVFSNATQGRQTVQDYHCEVKLLLKHMQFFKPVLQGLAPGQDTEIAVQCNLTTFDWLMAYVKASSTGVQPVLDCSNCMPILVACSYLKMTQLIKEAVQFTAANILQLAAAGVDIAGLDSALVTKIAKATSEESLETLLQHCEGVQLPRMPTLKTAGYQQQAVAEGTASANSSSCSNALLQKFYKHKLEALLKEHNTTLLRCKTCQQLFSAASHHKLQCPVQAGCATDRQPELPLHQPDPDWRFQDFLRQQRQQAQAQPQQQPQQQLHKQQDKQQTTSLRSQPPSQQQQLHCGVASPTSWRNLYYLTWGHVTVLYCTACHQHFPARQYNHCSYHPLAPVFASEADAGQHPCCGRPAWRPGLASAHSQGCCAKQHQAALRLQQQSPNRQQQRPKQQQPQQQQQQAQTQEGRQDAAERALQLLQRFGSIITEHYMPMPLQSQQPDAAPAIATAAAAGAGAGDSSNGVGCSSSSIGSSSRPGSRGAGTLPLLVRMTNRSSPHAAMTADGGTDSGCGGRHPGLSLHGHQLEAGAGLNRSRPGTAAAAAATSAAGHAQHAGMARESVITGNSSLDAAAGNAAGDPAAAAGSDEHGADVLDEASAVLDYRSAHLRSFMEAVHAAAECRGRGSSLTRVAGGSLTSRMQRELRVALGSTFSAAGAAGRQVGRPSVLHAVNPLRGASAAPVVTGSRQRAALVPTRGGRLDSCAYASSVSSKGPDTAPEAAAVASAAAAAAADVRASRVNRTLLLELMHEDDVYRMGLLMRKLDAARQLPPDGACSSSTEPGMLSEVEVAQATNSMLFTGLAGKAGHVKADGSRRVQRP